MSPTFFALCGAISGGLMVVLGAFGAHALKSVLDEHSSKTWEKAVFYQAVHSLVLLLLPAYSEFVSPLDINIVGFVLLIGIALFSGSLYLLAVTGKKYLGGITPFGGVAFIAGWIWLALSLLEATG